jgi:NAD(P) transhydrogenase subunit alpha
MKHGVKIVGYGTLPAMIPTDASAMYARNLLHFVNLLVDPKTGELTLDRSDEIIAGALVCADGARVNA